MGPLPFRCTVDRFVVYCQELILFLIPFPLQTHFHLNSLYSLGALQYFLLFFCKTMNAFLLLCLSLQLSGGRRGGRESAFYKSSHSPSPYPIKATNESHLQVK